MKKFLSLFLCALLLLATLSGCQSTQPSLDLPFEEYGGYQILNISKQSASIGAGGNKASSYSAVQGTTLSLPIFPLVTQIEILEQTLQLSYLGTEKTTIGDYKYSEYQIVNEPLQTPWIDSEHKAVFFEDGTLQTLQDPPISGIDLSGLNDEQIRLKIESLFAKYVDFTKYTDCKIDRQSIFEAELITLKWSRSYQGFVVGDTVTITIHGDILKFFHISSQMNELPPVNAFPSTEALDSILKEYIEDHYEGTGKQLLTFEIRSKVLTKFQGKYALVVEMRVGWLHPIDSLEYGEGMRVLILLE